MHRSSLVSLLALAASQASAVPAACPSDHSNNTTRNCRDLTVNISISAENRNFTLKPPHGDIEVTKFVLDFIQPGSDFRERISAGTSTVSGSYQIAATYCEPSDGPGKALQILTHGIAFDRSYWDPPVHNYNYSYVNAALSENYSVFFYDRLGVGQSSKGDPLNEIQPALELSALQALTSMLRNNSLPGIQTQYEKYVHVGHSFGSLLTYAFTNSFPALSDGIALTGFSLDANFSVENVLCDNFVAANSVLRWKDLPDGYLSINGQNALQTGFFAESFDPKLLEAAYNATQPRTIGETISQDVVPLQSQFGGPVLVVTGDRDFPACGGNCTVTDPSIPAMTKGAFVKATSFNATIISHTGHALNFHYTWPTTYASVSNFFDQVL